MGSRGYAYALSAGARRSVVLFWTALFMCSVLLQYMALAAPARVLAVHDDGLFELDGNVENSAAAGDDWNAVFNDNSSAFQTTFITDPVNGNNDKYFDGGGTKDVADIPDWAWTTVSQPQDKNDIAHAYAAAYKENGSLLVYFGLDRYASNGAAQVGFWFLKESFGLTGGPTSGAFSGQHVNGDVLVQIDFENGGANPVLRVYEWDNGLVLKETGGSCATAPNGDARCAIAATDTTNPAWPFDDKFANGVDNDIPAGGMVEGGIDLTALNLDQGCFASFVAETRSSPSPDSTLSDFASGSFALCSKPDIATHVQQDGQNVSVINKGESVTDHAALSGDSGTVTGKVDFFVCGPDNSEPDCSSGGDKVGSTKTLSGGVADSDAFTPSQTGFYCFRAEYTPAAGSKYLADSHTNRTSECFEVIPAGVDVTKTADDASVSAGDPIGFTVSITSTGPGTAFGVKVTDTLPADAGLDWSIDDANTTGTWTIDNGVLGFGGANGVTMAKNAEFHVHITSPTTPASCGKVSNTADATTTNDGTDSASASVTVACPDVKVTKTPDGGSVNAGGVATFSIMVENVGDGTATGVEVSDDLPAGVHWTESEADCSISGADGSQVLTCDVGTLAPGASKTYQVSAQTDGGDCGTLDNTATASSTNEPSSALGNNGDDGSIDVLCAAIDIEKTADDGTVNAGDPIGFTITVTNKGDGLATAVTVSDPLPTGTGLSWSISPANPDWTIDNGTLQYGPADLEAGDSVSVHVVSGTTADSCGTIDNTATASAGNDGSDEASASVTIQCPDVTVVKTAVASPVSAGDPIAFDLTVSNSNITGTGTAYDVTLEDPLPDGIDWSENSANCTIEGSGDNQVLKCAWDELAKGASATVRVSGTTSAAVCGNVPNTATVAASNEAAGDTGNNSDDATVVVQCPDIKVVKTADASPISADDVAAFTITVSNIGAGTATNVTLNDPLPAGVDWSIDPAVAGCSIANSTLTCSFDSFAAGFSLDIHISGETTAAVCGTLDNTVTVGAANEPGDVLDNNTSSASIDVKCADIELTKTADDDPVLAGQPIGFTIDVKNNGAGTAKGVTVSDTLPADAGLSWSIDPAVQGCSISGGVLTCSFGDLASGAVRSVHIVSPTTELTCGLVDNSATVTTTNDGSDTGVSKVDVQCASISLVKRADPAPDKTELVTKPGDVLFTYLVTNTGTATLENIELVDDNATPADTSDDVTIGCPKTVLVAEESMLCTASLPVGFGVRTNIAEVTANPVLDVEAEVSATDDAVVRVPQLTIAKAITSGAPGGAPVLEGDELTFTLTYDLSFGPVAHGVITDVLPDGLTYIAGTATSNDEFTFAGYDSATRTLTWTAATVTKDGAVSYQVVTATGAAGLEQPLVNVATIRSDQTEPDSDTKNVPVGKVEELTPPPTSTLDQAPEPSTGNGLLLLLVAIVGFVVLAGVLTPAPARARRRNRRR